MVKIYIFGKVFLRALCPVEILLVRFVLGFFALAAVFPHPMNVMERRQELYFALAGLCGVCLYYLLENMALIETQASNVGVIISIAPFFTAIVTQITARGEERMCPTFFIGFAAAMTGIGLISFNGAGLEMNPQGDLLAVMAAFVWACYSVLVKKVGSFGYHVVQSTRRIFAYGQLFMIPALFPFGFRLDLSCLSGRPPYFRSSIYAQRPGSDGCLPGGCGCLCRLDTAKESGSAPERGPDRPEFRTPACTM